MFSRIKAGRQLLILLLALKDQFKKTVASLISNCYSIYLVCREPSGITYSTRLYKLDLSQGYLLYQHPKRKELELCIILALMYLRPLTNVSY